MKSSHLGIGALLIGCFLLGGGGAWWMKNASAPRSEATGRAEAPSEAPPPRREGGSPITPVAPWARIAQVEELLSASPGAQLEADEILAQIGEELKRDPKSWLPVVERVCGSPDLKIALRLAERLGDAMDAVGEEVWVRRLLRGAHARERRIAASALGRAKRSGSLEALVSAAESDADAETRLASLRSMGRIKGNGVNEAAAGLIDATLRLRSELDSDASLRAVAKELLLPQPPDAPRQPGKDPEKK